MGAAAGGGDRNVGRPPHQPHKDRLPQPKIPADPQGRILLLFDLHGTLTNPAVKPGSVGRPRGSLSSSTLRAGLPWRRRHVAYGTASVDGGVGPAPTLPHTHHHRAASHSAHTHKELTPPSIQGQKRTRAMAGALFSTPCRWHRDSPRLREPVAAQPAERYLPAGCVHHGWDQDRQQCPQVSGVEGAHQAPHLCAAAVGILCV